MKAKYRIISFFVLLLILTSIYPVSAETQNGNIILNCEKEGYEFAIIQVAKLDLPSGKYIPNKNIPEKIYSLFTDKVDNSQNILAELDLSDISECGEEIDERFSSSGSKTYKVEPGLYYIKATKFPKEVYGITNSLVSMPHYEKNNWNYDNIEIKLATKIREKAIGLTKNFILSNKSLSKITSIGTNDIEETAIYFPMPGSQEAKVKNMKVTDTFPHLAADDYRIYCINSKNLSINDINASNQIDEEKYVEIIKSKEQTNYVFNSDFINRFSPTTEEESYLIVICYKTSIYRDPIIGGHGNKSTATLFWTDALNSEHSLSDEVTAYTFKLKAEKVDAADVSEKLKGAKFRIYRTRNDASDDINHISESTSDKNGLLFIDDTFKEGSYFLREIEAPLNYAKSNMIYDIAISPKYYENGVLENPSDGVFELSIENSKTSLPESGSTLSIIFIISGSVLVFVGVIMIVISVRSIKNKKK